LLVLSVVVVGVGCDYVDVGDDVAVVVFVYVVGDGIDGGVGVVWCC